MWCGRSHALAKRRTPAPAARAACRRLQGHLNPCFGWDFAPASYVAVFMCAADVYLAWTYAVLEALRTRLRDTDNRIDRAERFSLVTTYLHGIASMMWLLLWLVGPPDGRWEVHLAIFSAALGFRYLCTLGNYVENRFGKAFEKGHVNTSHTLFIIVYGLVVAVLPVLYFVDITVYAAEGARPLASTCRHDLIVRCRHPQARFRTTLVHWQAAQGSIHRCRGSCCRLSTSCGWAVCRRARPCRYQSPRSVSSRL
jgi:hypothetical protein|eukprot:4223777-Prymnesium_polylepis.1